MRHLRWLALVTLPFIPLSSSCHERAGRPVEAPQSPEACEREKAELERLLQALPKETLKTDLGALTESSVGSTPREGPVLELSEQALRFQGQPLAPAELPRQLGSPGPRRLYLAAAPDTTIGRIRGLVAALPRDTELSLLVRTRRDRDVTAQAPGTSERTRAVVAEVLSERDARLRRQKLREGYSELTSCGALDEAVARADQAPEATRWPLLRDGALAALPNCACESLSSPSLRALFAADQRAGTASLAAVPLSFVRDERCNASMRLRSVGRLLEQIEKFDEDHAGKWQDDALRFEQVITNDRLLVEFCDALPGETLAALEREKRSVYFRAPGREGCDAWSFEPLSPGAPLGTVRRKAPGSGGHAFHYWQAAEEISLFGPLIPETPSKPTDERDWPCKVTHQLTGIDADAVHLENGRWFFSEAACLAAPASVAVYGCATEP
jgi:hypothetical protein